MKNINLETVFKEKLIHFEGEVNPALWNNINKNLTTTKGNVSSSNWKGGAAIASVVLIATALVTYNFLSEDVSKTFFTTNSAVEKKSEGNNEKSTVIEAPILVETQTKNAAQTNQAVKLKTNETQISSASAKESEVSLPLVDDKAASETKQAQQIEDIQPNAEASQTASNIKKPKSKAVDITKITTPSVAVPDAKSEINYAIDSDNSLKVNFSSTLENLSYDWNFGDGAHSSEAYPSHNYDKEGKYNVLCTITDTKSNKVISSKKLVEVIEPIVFFVPNSFSPNNDGNNDYYQVIVHSKISDFKMDIYDLHQKLLFSSNNPSDKWAGPEQLNPAIIQDSRFVAIIKVKSTSGRTETKTTSITIN